MAQAGHGLHGSRRIESAPIGLAEKIDSPEDMQRGEEKGAQGKEEQREGGERFAGPRHEKGRSE